MFDPPNVKDGEDIGQVSRAIGGWNSEGAHSRLQIVRVITLSCLPERLRGICIYQIPKP